MKRFARGDDGNEKGRALLPAQGSGEGGRPGPPLGSGTMGGRKYSRAEALKLLSTGLAGTVLLSGGLVRTSFAATSPSNPGSLYVLNWEDIAQRSVPGNPPPGWAREYDPTVVH